MLRSALIALLAFAPATAAAEETGILLSIEELPDPWTVRLSAGIAYSEGRYGEFADTEVLSVPMSMRISKGAVNFGLSIPWVRFEGPGSLVDAGGPVAETLAAAGGSRLAGSDVLPGTADEPASGFGDAVLSASYGFPVGNSLFLDIGGRVKLPAASADRRLGTGKMDFTALANVVRLFGPAAVYGEVRHRFSGNSRDLDIRNVWGWTVGASAPVGDAITMGIDYDWQEASFTGGNPISEVTAWSNIALSRQVRLQIYGATGFTNNSVDLAGGLGVTFRFD